MRLSLTGRRRKPAPTVNASNEREREGPWALPCTMVATNFQESASAKSDSLRFVGADPRTSVLLSQWEADTTVAEALSDFAFHNEAAPISKRQQIRVTCNQHTQHRDFATLCSKVHDCVPFTCAGVERRRHVRSVKIKIKKLHAASAKAGTLSYRGRKKWGHRSVYCRIHRSSCVKFVCLFVGSVKSEGSPTPTPET